MDASTSPSVYVAPLLISKTKHLETRNTSIPIPATSRTQQALEMTPPLTPHSSGENMAFYEQAQPMQFHPYLRAFYPYHPTCDANSGTITLPLNEGDIVLVHSVHTNGWADGTLLMSGARGWLPTNYCVGYDHEPMYNLMKALTNLWDLLHKGSEGGSCTIPTGDYTRGLVAGVRFLLVSRRFGNLSEIALVCSCGSSTDSILSIGENKLPQSGRALDQITQWLTS